MSNEQNNQKSPKEIAKRLAALVIRDGADRVHYHTDETTNSGGAIFYASLAAQHSHAPSWGQRAVAGAIEAGIEEALSQQKPPELPNVPFRFFVRESVQEQKGYWFTDSAGRAFYVCLQATTITPSIHHPQTLANHEEFTEVAFGDLGKQVDALGQPEATSVVPKARWFGLQAGLIPGDSCHGHCLLRVIDGEGCYVFQDGFVSKPVTSPTVENVERLVWQGIWKEVSEETAQRSLAKLATTKTKPNGYLQGYHQAMQDALHLTGPKAA